MLPISPFSLVGSSNYSLIHTARMEIRCQKVSIKCFSPSATPIVVSVPLSLFLLTCQGSFSSSRSGSRDLSDVLGHLAHCVCACISIFVSSDQSRFMVKKQCLNALKKICCQITVTSVLYTSLFLLEFYVLWLKSSVSTNKCVNRETFFFCFTLALIVELF